MSYLHYQVHQAAMSFFLEEIREVADDCRRYHSLMMHVDPVTYWPKSTVAHGLWVLLQDVRDRGPSVLALYRVACCSREARIQMRRGERPNLEELNQIMLELRNAV